MIDLILVNLVDSFVNLVCLVFVLMLMGFWLPFVVYRCVKVGVSAYYTAQSKHNVQMTYRGEKSGEQR